MKIAYVARHGGIGNDDEGAIAYALESLGHEVLKIGENVLNVKTLGKDCDFLLFHKWSQMGLVNKFKMPKVFWYFDLVTMDNEELDHRFESRVTWIEHATRDCDLGFLTDGDWVNSDTTGKLVKLTQGADSRFARSGKAKIKDIPILFTGRKAGGGRTRRNWVTEMEETYKDHFVQVSYGVHQQKLADLIARARVVIAPDGPATDHYWSNRVYLTLGFGGFLLHPFCEDLLTDYECLKEIVYYVNRREMHAMIEHYLSKPEKRKEIAKAGYERTIQEHTYRHRCKTLIKTVQERLF